MPHITPPLGIADGIVPVAIGLVFIAVMQRIDEPRRLRLNALLAAGASTTYLGGGLGGWEIVYMVVAASVAYRATASYRYVGVAWLMHSGWDLVHHLWARPILDLQATSSFGCAITDALLA